MGIHGLNQKFIHALLSNSLIKQCPFYAGTKRKFASSNFESTVAHNNNKKTFLKSTLAPGHNDNRKDQNQRNHAVLQFLTFNSLIDSEATHFVVFP